MLNLQLSRFNATSVQPHDVTAGVQPTEEGLCMVLVDNGNGRASISPSTGSGTEVFAGFSYGHYMAPSTLPLVTIIDAVGTTLTLPKTPISGQLRLMDGTQLLTAGNPATTANEYSISGNVVTLHSGQSNRTISVQMRFTPTVSEVAVLFGEGSQGQSLQARSAVYGRLNCISRDLVATSCFLADAAYTPGAALRMAPNGFVTTGGTGTVIPGASVYQAPASDNNGFLVIRIG